MGKRYMRGTVAARQGKEACRQPMVRAEVLEGQIAGYVGGMRLPLEYLGEVVAELRCRRESRPPEPGKAQRLQREMKRWQRLHALRRNL